MLAHEEMPEALRRAVLQARAQARGGAGHQRILVEAHVEAADVAARLHEHLRERLPREPLEEARQAERDAPIGEARDVLGADRVEARHRAREIARRERPEILDPHRLTPSAML
ncbi:MAG: hypothetical protein U0414_34500 [Polyangiaceae bacterium]